MDSSRGMFLLRNTDIQAVISDDRRACSTTLEMKIPSSPFEAGNRGIEHVISRSSIAYRSEITISLCFI